MPMELKVPSMGESITEAQVGVWRKREGDWVERDETVVELESDKAALEVPAPVAGVLTHIVKKEGERVGVGETLGIIDETAQPSARKPTASATPAPAARPAIPDKSLPPRTPSAAPKIMPAAERALAMGGVDPALVEPTGPGGRMLKEDVQRHLASHSPAPAAPLSSPTSKPTPAIAPVAPAPAIAAHELEEVVPMSLLRRKIAERLVSAQQNAALLTTFNEVDMSAVMTLRSEHQEEFQKRYGVKLGFMSFFVKATVDALKRIPQLNAEIRGDSIVYKNHYDIGVAVGGGRGLVVVVVKGADRMSFAEVELAINDLASRARDNKLRPEELEGGTFTISNGGVYGSLLSTPIVNPPQSGILGLHAAQDRPVARNGQVVIRPMMYLALTYDHRIVDGREAVTFLRRIKDAVENPARMLLEV